MINLYFHYRLYSVQMVFFTLCLDVYLRMGRMWVASCIFQFDLGRRNSLQNVGIFISSDGYCTFIVRILNKSFYNSETFWCIQF